MVFYIFVVAVLNLSLGFAFALLVARRGPGQGLAAAKPEADAVAAYPPEAEDPFEPPDDAGDEMAAEGDAVTADSEGLLQEVSFASPTDSDEKKQPAPQPQVPRRRSPGETSVCRLQDTVERYNRRLADVDRNLRGLAGDGNVQSVKGYLDSLQAANEEYLGAWEVAHEAFEDLFRGQHEFDDVCRNLRKAMERQCQEIEETSKVTADFNFQGDLERGAQEVVGRTTKLLDANCRMRETLNDAAVGVARSEGRLDSPDESGRIEESTGLVGKVGLEDGLRKCWAEDPECAKSLCIAMIDLDHFARVNAAHGEKTGDRVLRAVAQLLSSESRAHGTAGRLSGQRFLIVFPDVELRSATNIVEQIRQSLELLHLRTEEGEIRLTASCAVNERTPDDTQESLLERSGATLCEAKRYGRNRTFLFENGYPAPVVPPSLSLPEKSISI